MMDGEECRVIDEWDEWDEKRWVMGRMMMDGTGRDGTVRRDLLLEAVAVEAEEALHTVAVALLRVFDCHLLELCVPAPINPE